MAVTRPPIALATSIQFWHRFTRNKTCLRCIRNKRLHSSGTQQAVSQRFTDLTTHSLTFCAKLTFYECEAQMIQKINETLLELNTQRSDQSRVEHCTDWPLTVVLWYIVLPSPTIIVHFHFQFCNKFPLQTSTLTQTATQHVYFHFSYVFISTLNIANMHSLR